MKLGLVTKPNKKNTATSKKKKKAIMMTSCRKIVTSFFLFMANLQPSQSRIPDAWSIKLTFSIIITFYLTITENRTKKVSNTALILLL